MVQALLAIEGKFKDPPLPADVPAVQGLRAACAVLVVAVFEDFLKSTFRDEIDDFSTKSLVFNKMPKKLQVAAVFLQLEQAMEGPGEKFDRIAGVTAAATRVAGSKIMAESFASTNSNPNPLTVKGMFRNIDCPDIFAKCKARFEKTWGTPISATFVSDKLSEIVNRRHAAAHSGRLLNASRQDLKESVRFVRKLGATLELELRAHLRVVAKTSR